MKMPSKVPKALAGSLAAPVTAKNAYIKEFERKNYRMNIGKVRRFSSHENSIWV